MSPLRRCKMYPRLHKVVKMSARILHHTQLPPYFLNRPIYKHYPPALTHTPPATLKSFVFSQKPSQSNSFSPCIWIARQQAGLSEFWKRKLQGFSVSILFYKIRRYLNDIMLILWPKLTHPTTYKHHPHPPHTSPIMRPPYSVAKNLRVPNRGKFYPRPR